LNVFEAFKLFRGEPRSITLWLPPFPPHPLFDPSTCHTAYVHHTPLECEISISASARFIERYWNEMEVATQAWNTLILTMMNGHPVPPSKSDKKPVQFVDSFRVLQAHQFQFLHRCIDSVSFPSQ
jgi:hypothetical protein